MRNYHDPKYREWRLKVLKRDGFKCKMPLCKCKTQLRAHHIKRWADYPQLRFEVSNGITLCKKCHDKVFNKEDDWAATFMRLITNTKLELDIWRIKKGIK